MGSAQDVTGSSRLLNLPAELRNGIYRLVLCTDKPLNPADSAMGARAALLRVNKQVNSEATSIFYTENTFALNVTASNAASAVGWVHSLGPGKARLIGTLSVAFGSCDRTHRHWRILLALDEADLYNHLRSLRLKLSGCWIDQYTEQGGTIARRFVDAGVNVARIIVKAALHSDKGYYGDQFSWELRNGFKAAL